MKAFQKRNNLEKETNKTRKNLKKTNKYKDQTYSSSQRFSFF